jgi:hypothetical protein
MVGGLKFPKPEPRKRVKARKDGRKARLKAGVKALVFERQAGICFAWGVSPICRKVAVDRHELKPVGRGGLVTSKNCVAVCRRCHDASQNSLGGRPLTFEWPGKDSGKPPDADAPGGVWAVWRGIWKGVKPERRTA